MLTLEEMSNQAHEAHALLNSQVAMSRAPKVDSPAADLLRAEGKWSVSPGSVEPVQNLLSYAAAYLGASLDHLHGAAIATVSEAAFDVDSLARSSIEAAAFSRRLTDVQLTDAERLQRGFVDQMWSLKEIRKLTSECDTGEWRKRTRRMEQLLTAGRKRQLATPDATISKVAKSREKATKAIEQLFDAGRNDDADLTGRVLYQRASGIAHSNPIMLISQSTKASAISDREAVVIFGPSTVRYAISLLGAVIGTSIASQSFAELHGHELPVDGVHQVGQKLLEVVQQFHGDS